MAKLPVVYYPDAVLKTRCADVTQIDGELVQLGNDMAETMYTSRGIGLAAPQVGRTTRLITVDIQPDGEPGKDLRLLINPVIMESHGHITYEEGCLSFPGVTAEIKRKEKIRVMAWSDQGSELDFDADGLFAICIQHEIDHLNGVTFLDRLGPIHRKLVLRTYLAEREEGRREEEREAILSLHE
jgi:peptide deformylase